MTSPSRVKTIVEAVVRVGREEILKVADHSGACIAATRIAMTVLKSFGISSYPLSCKVYIYNPILTDFIEAVKRPPDPHEMEEYVNHKGGWAIELGKTNKEPEDRYSWDGHLVVIAAGRQYLLDLTLDQVHRPLKGILLGPSVFEIPPEWPKHMPLVYTVNRCLLVYRPYLQDRSYERSPNWIEDHREIIPNILKRLREEIKE